MTSSLTWCRTLSDNVDMTKGPEPRSAKITVRIPESLLEALERKAAKDRRSVSDVVVLMLEDAFTTLTKQAKK